MLDAGSALNHSFLLEHPVFKDITLDIFTFAPEKSCEWQKGISYLYGDLRDLPYKDALFDTVVSISTLEHVGMDNSFYKKRTKEHATDDVFRAFSECKRVLKQSGCLLFSVPFGTYEDHTAFQQFDAALLKRCEDFSNRRARRRASFFTLRRAGSAPPKQTAPRLSMRLPQAGTMRPQPEPWPAAPGGNSGLPYR